MLLKKHLKQINLQKSNIRFTNRVILRAYNLLNARKFFCVFVFVSAIDDPDKMEYCYVNGELKEQTHAALFKFVPRHQDEISLEVIDCIMMAVYSEI